MKRIAIGIVFIATFVLSALPGQVAVTPAHAGLQECRDRCNEKANRCNQDCMGKPSSCNQECHDAQWSCTQDCEANFK